MLSRYGFTNEEILKCATNHDARIVGREDRIGWIEDGKLADIVVLGRNPLEDIGGDRAVHMVIKGGAIVCAPVQVDHTPSAWRGAAPFPGTTLVMSTAGASGQEGGGCRELRTGGSTG